MDSNYAGHGKRGYALRNQVMQELISALIVLIVLTVQSNAQTSHDPHYGWCGTDRLFESEYGGVSLKKSAQCQVWGDCDLPENRDMWLTDPSSPTFYVR